MARFIIRFYGTDNVQCKEMVVIGRKLTKKEVIQMEGRYRPGEELYYIPKKNEFSIRWVVRYNGILDFASYGAAPKYHCHKIVEA